MKRIYKQLLFGMMLIVPTGVAADETVTIKNFSPDENGVVYNQNGIRVTVVKDAAQASYIQDQTVQLGCLSVNGVIPALYLCKDLTVKASVDIEATEISRAVSSVKFIGSSYTGSNQSMWILAFSLDGSTFPETPNNIYPGSAGTTTLATFYTFPKDATSACNDAATVAIPEKVYQGPPNGGVRTEYSRSDIKKIRLAGASIQSKSLTNTENAYLYGIILTLADTGTGIGEPATAAKTPVKSVYYDLTGKTVSANAKGFIIRKTVYSDGSVNNEKTYNR